MADIVTILRRADSTPAAGAKILFRRTEYPLAAEAAVISDEDIVAESDENGAIDVTLVAGTYFMWVGRSRRRLLVVPDDGDVHFLEALINGDMAGTPVDDLPVSSREMYDNPAAFSVAAVSSLVKFVMLLEDAQQPTPSQKVWFVRQGTSDAADGVNVIADSTGIKFRRVQ